MSEMDNIDWSLRAVLIVCVIFTFGALFYLAREQKRQSVSALKDTLIVTDTLYIPPPGYTEAFRLDCRWIPREESRDEG